MSAPIKVIIADDHVLVLDGMRQALDSLPDIDVVAIATDGRELTRVLDQLRPDVLLVDIEMPHGSGLTVLRSLDDPPPTLVVTMHADDDHRKRAAAAGASGFLSKSTPLNVLAAAIRAAHDGVDLFALPDMGVGLEPYRQARLSPRAESLTARERELLGLLAGGVSRTEDLANELYISQKTVKNHLSNIYEKLGVSTRAEAAVKALRLGLGPSDPDRTG
ncbi:MAG: response regulator transcription factor [Actinomycetota bacterium]|nr:response regulator transcription factor [Actinomycetota bacterium]